MLRMRSPALFFVVLLALIAVVVLGRNGVGSIARLAFVVIGFGVVPFAFSSDRPLRKLLVIALMNAMIVVAEAVSIAAWYAVVGLDITDYDVVRSHMGAFVCTHILHLLVLTALFSGFHAALGRFDRTGAVDMRGFVWFPVIRARWSKIHGHFPAWRGAGFWRVRSSRFRSAFLRNDGVVGSVPCHRSRLVFGDEAACEEAS